jgi:protein O-GlcNAc transferase
MKLWGPIAVVMSIAVFLAGPALADEASAHYHKAMAYKQRGDVKAAIKELHDALEKREDYAAVHHSLGMLYRQQKNFMKAIYHLERAATLEPKAAQVHYSLGLAYNQAGRTEEAITTLNKAATLAPKDDQIQAALGTLLIRKDPKQAVPHLLAAVAVKPQDPEYLHQLGLAYRKSNDNKNAEKYLRQSWELKEDAGTAFDLGVLYRRLDKQDKAVESYEAAIRLDPKMAPAYWDVGQMYIQMKRSGDAIGSFETYLKLKGDSKDAEIARKRIKELRGK